MLSCSWNQLAYRELRMLRSDTPIGISIVLGPVAQQDLKLKKNIYFYFILIFF
jgi:hypothetical protein